MVWISNGIWTPEAQPFEIWTNGYHFVKNHVKTGPKCPDFKWPILSEGLGKTYFPPSVSVTKESDERHLAPPTKLST